VDGQRHVYVALPRERELVLVQEAVWARGSKGHKDLETRKATRF